MNNHEPLFCYLKRMFYIATLIYTSEKQKNVNIKNININIYKFNENEGKNKKKSESPPENSNRINLHTTTPNILSLFRI